MVRSKAFVVVLFWLFSLVAVPQFIQAATPNSGDWSGTTGSGKPVSFQVISSGTQWYMFAFTFSWYGAYVSGTTTITTYGPGNINFGMFDFYEGTYGFSGNFGSTSTGAGLYVLNNYKIIIYNGYVLVTGGGSWTASGPADPLTPVPPFGSFDTPIDGSTVMSSIAVTGWALDDTGINSVKIYREDGGNLAYIGDALMVEGARPDIAAAYPQYPNNTKAGWGYMMLTNFLPNGGNGTFTIHALATDSLNNTTYLGSKTIYCDNAHAVKPFGAIDSPIPGSTASGSSYTNVGWALTPPPNTVPTDGSTITVWVDGVPLGHPTYNLYRSDIASLFPGYNNSNGAAGYYKIDTTKYSNGVHSIFWTATDNVGNTDGIGSRYFSINNSGSPSLDQPTYHSQVTTVFHTICPTDRLTGESPLALEFKKGFQPNSELLCSIPDNTGTAHISIKELEPLEIRLTDPISGYLMIDNNNYTPLPIGSTLDLNAGNFYWMPGPGFLGEYRLVFVEKRPGDKLHRRDILVTISPKFPLSRPTKGLTDQSLRNK